MGIDEQEMIFLRIMFVEIPVKELVCRYTGLLIKQALNIFVRNICRQIRLPELFSEMEAARIQGKYHQVMKQFQKLPLVILDEFLLIPASDQEQRDLLELMEYRCGQASTIFCSQFRPEGWHKRLGGGALKRKITAFQKEQVTFGSWEIYRVIYVCMFLWVVGKNR